MAGAVQLGQLPLWVPRSDWRPPQVSDLPSWKGAKRVGIDVETYDPDLTEMGIGVRRRGTYLAGISFAIEDGPEYYVPLRHQGGDNVEDPEAAIRYFQDQAKVFRGELVGMNLGYDLDWLLESEINFQPSFFRDVSVADPLIYELHRRYNLSAIAERWGLPGKEEDLLREAARAYGLDPKGAIALLPARFVGPYAGTDARRPLQVLLRQERAIEEQGLQDIFDLESRVLPVLVRMRRRGVRVSYERMEEVRSWSLKEEADHLGQVRHITGISLTHDDVWTAEPFARALEATGVEVPKTAEGAPSITKELLNGVAMASKDSAAGKVAASLRRAREMSKLRQFADGVEKHAVNGRIHCTFNQLRNSGHDGLGDGGGSEKGVKFGRLSCECPNLQQQPSRGDYAARWRSIYLPEEGCEWTCADYSQQEPRMLVHYASLPYKNYPDGLPNANMAAQRYRDDPKTDNHRMMTQLIYGDDVVNWDNFKKLRTDCKQIFLGVCYGEGGAKMCAELGLPTRFAVFYSRADGYRPPSYFEDWNEARSEARRSEGRAFRVAGAEGQAILDTFNEKLPFVKMLAKRCENKARSKGTIRTLMGRVCHFPEKDDGTFDWAYKALNRLIQGSCADQMKKALVEIDAAGIFLQLQVHDESDSSTESREQSRIIQTIMRESVQLKIPFNVDLEIGPSWGEAEELKEAA